MQNAKCKFEICTFHFALFILHFAFILIGCTQVAPKVINAGLSSYFQPERLRTLAMMPLKTDSGNAQIGEQVMRELTVQILQLDRFELIDPYKVSTLVEEEQLDSAELNDMLVRTIGRKLGADAILLGSVTHYRPSQRRYLLFKTSPTLSLNLRVIALTDAVPTTIWTVNDTFSGGDKAVQQLVDPSERSKIRTDAQFLIKVMSREIAKTLNF